MPEQVQDMKEEMIFSLFQPHVICCFIFPPDDSFLHLFFFLPDQNFYVFKTEKTDTTQNTMTHENLLPNTRRDKRKTTRSSETEQKLRINNNSMNIVSDPDVQPEHASTSLSCDDNSFYIS